MAIPFDPTHHIRLRDMIERCCSAADI